MRSSTFRLIEVGGALGRSARLLSGGQSIRRTRITAGQGPVVLEAFVNWYIKSIRAYFGEPTA